MLLQTVATFLFCVSICHAKSDCPGGQVRTNRSCEECPPGTYNLRSKSHNLCVPCPEGTFNPFKGAPDRKVCRSCLENTFNNVKGATGCVPCPKDARFYRGATVCLKCRPGTEISLFNGKFCTLCERGFYRNSTATLRCELCPFPLSSPKGSKSIAKCRQCPPGRVWRHCGRCPAGTFKPARRGACQPCPPGQVSPKGATRCIKCPRGKFKANDRVDPILVFCKSCPEGKLSEEGADICRDAGAECPSGFFETKTGACITCKDGFYFNKKKKECGKCPPGSVSKGRTQEKCVRCRNGLVPDSFNRLCRCPAGFFLTEKSACKPCPAGTGGNSKSPELRGIDGCIKCAPGSYADKPGSLLCKQCPFGVVADKEGSTSCKRCPSGTFPSFDPSRERKECVALENGCKPGYKPVGTWGSFCSKQ